MADATTAAGGPGNLRCTSGDVEISTATLLSDPPPTDLDENPLPKDGDSFVCAAGSTVLATVEITLKSNANSVRSDIGLWVKTDGDDTDLYSGTCTHLDLMIKLMTNVAI